MEFAELATAIRIVELEAIDRPAAIRELAEVTEMETDGLSLDRLLEAIEEREATAQTIVVPGFALPHALVDWSGNFRIVLGRSRSGVQYGTPDTEPVHLIVLLVIGRRDKKKHLEALAVLAEFLGAEEFRQQIVEARDTHHIQRLIYKKAGVATEKRPSPMVPRMNAVLASQATQLVESLSAQAILIAADNVEDVPWITLSGWQGRLLVVTSQSGDELPVERADTHLLELPHATLTRMDRVNVGLLLFAAEELLTTDANVVCMTGPGDSRLDSITVIKPEPQFEAMFGGKAPRHSGNRIPPVVILRAVALAIELAEEGRESRSVGTMFVIGDSRQVLRHAKQLVLNPFHGYSKTLRSLLDPSLGETIKEFAQLDGAFVVRADGMVLSAGTYLVPRSSKAKIPSGLGTRHQSAAAITSHTEAMAIVVSQSTGTVTVFRHGRIVLKLERATSTRS